MRKILQLQHHRHTAKHLSHQHTSFRGLLVVLLVSGVAVFGVQKAAAVEYKVTAKIPAPMPDGAAYILIPSDGSTFEHPQIDVSGTCPVISPAIIVSLWRGSNYLGSSVCGIDGTFTIGVTLLTGLNNLTPKITTITFDDGAIGPMVGINYSPPIPPGPSFVITPTKNFIIFTPGEPTQLELNFSGGESPYIVSINWGDGTVDDFVVEKDGPRIFEHVYSKEVPVTITVKATDNKGSNQQFDIGAISLARYYGSAEPNITTTTQAGTTLPKVFNGAWVVYGFVLVLVLSLWAFELFKKTFIVSWEVMPASHKKRVRHP